MMVEHVLVETNFLIAAFGMPHRRNPDAVSLWSRFQESEIKLHIPFLCFQEARNRISRDVRNPITELKGIWAYIEDSGIRNWEDAEVNKFVQSVEAYLSRESTISVVDKRLSGARLGIADGVIHGSDEVFSRMPIDGVELDYNDHLILASVLHRAEELPENSEAYFCTTNYRHFAPSYVGSNHTTKVHPVLAGLYGSCGIRFMDTFDVP